MGEPTADDESFASGLGDIRNGKGGVACSPPLLGVLLGEIAVRTGLAAKICCFVVCRGLSDRGDKLVSADSLLGFGVILGINFSLEPSREGKGGRGLDDRFSGVPDVVASITPCCSVW